MNLQPNNNNNNNNNQNIQNCTHTPSPQNTKQKKYPLCTVTHNIQGLNDKVKQQQILDYITLNKIDVMGVSETNMHPSTSKYTFRNNSHYRSYFNNDSPTIRGAGVGLLISNTYAKYIQKIVGHKGRVYLLTFS